jgi:hypothetical protein
MNSLSNVHSAHPQILLSAARLNPLNGRRDTGWWYHTARSAGIAYYRATTDQHNHSTMNNSTHFVSRVLCSRDRSLNPIVAFAFMWSLDTGREGCSTTVDETVELPSLPTEDLALVTSLATPALAKVKGVYKEDTVGIWCRFRPCRESRTALWRQSRAPDDHWR